jgi:hypothetical protein
MTKTTQPSSALRKAWLDATRPRTLPLALSCIALGSFLASRRRGLQLADYDAVSGNGRLPANPLQPGQRLW